MTRGAVVIEEKIRVPADVFDLERFREWAQSPDFPRSGRISYIGGEIEVDMSPEEIESHNKLKTQLVIELGRRVQSRDLGELLSDRALLVHPGAGLATEPDLTFSAWETLRSGRVRYGERVDRSERYVELVGSPDLVIEVVSDNSVRKDTVLLREKYFRAGIPEYWIVDARGETVDFRLLVPKGDAYAEVDADPDGYRRSQVLGGSFRIVKGQNPLGGASYRLLSR